MSHDRARLSALVDGELDHEARERVLAHLAQCEECRAVVEGERRVKSLLGGMPEAAPRNDFLATLNRLAVEPPDPTAVPKRALAKRRPARRGRSGGTLPRLGLSPQRHSGPLPAPPPAAGSQAGASTPGPAGVARGGRDAADAVPPAAGSQGAAPTPGPAGVARGNHEAVDAVPPSAAGSQAGAPAPGPAGVVRGGQDAADAVPPAGSQAGAPAPGPAGAARSGYDTADADLPARHPVPPPLVVPAAVAPRVARDPSRPAGGRPFGHPDPRASRRFRSSRFGRRFSVGVAGAASLAGMALVTAFTVGGATAPTTADVKVVPPVQRYTVQHADSSGGLPFGDPGAATATIGDANLTGLPSADR